jgi:hypothetical protein
MTLCAFRLGEPPLAATTLTLPLTRGRSRGFQSRGTFGDLSTAPVLPSTASLPPTSRQGRHHRRRFRPTAPDVPKRLRTFRPSDRHRSTHRALAQLTSRPQSFVRHTAPQRFDDEARRTATLRFTVRHPAPRRSLGGVQLPDGAPGGDRALAVGGMPRSVLCSQFDCQRAPFDSPRRPAAGASPGCERQDLKSRQSRRIEPRASRHDRLSPRRRLALSAHPRRPIRLGRSFFDRPSTDVAAHLRPARPPPTPRTTRRLRKARTPSPPALLHPDMR